MNNNCIHLFIGGPNGVKCAKCDLTLTAQEYAAFVTAPKEPAKKAGKKK